MARPAVIVALPPSESMPVSMELLQAGFEVMEVDDPRQLEEALEARQDVAIAILDGEGDPDEARAYDTVLRDAGRPVAALTVVSPKALERVTEMQAPDSINEYFTRPYSADSIRWRVEAMCIRRETVDDGSGPVLQNGDFGAESWAGRASTIAVFNPKGGVGKTTVATNLASALQTRKGKSVLLIDADTVTGHVTSSLGIDGVRTVADSWHDEMEGGPAESLLEIAAQHSSGMRVVALTDSPLNTDVLDPARLAAAIRAIRNDVDVVVIDLHPSYSALNQAIFTESDRILVPVTPDVPAIRAANEGRTVIELFPREKITADFDELADRVLGVQKAEPAPKAGFRVLPRVKEPARV